jgi:hypothetical protein
LAEASYPKAVQSLSTGLFTTYSGFAGTRVQILVGWNTLSTQICKKIDRGKSGVDEYQKRQGDARDECLKNNQAHALARGLAGNCPECFVGQFIK